MLRRRMLPHRLVLVAIVGAAMVGIVMVVGDGGSGPETAVVESPTGLVGSGISGGPPGAEPAAPVEFPASAPAAGRSSGESPGSGDEEPGAALSRAESSGSHNVSVAGPDGSGLVVTNSGTATADSGANTTSGSPDGTGANLETGPTEAIGNRSTTDINP